jgi:hypothetical protein
MVGMLLGLSDGRPVGLIEGAVVGTKLGLSVGGGLGGKDGLRVKSTELTLDSLIDATIPRESSTSLSRSSDNVSIKSDSQAAALVKLTSDTLLSTSKVTLQTTAASSSLRNVDLESRSLAIRLSVIRPSFSPPNSFLL